MSRHIFSIYHPSVLILYFFGAVITAMLTYSPYFILISFSAASLYFIYLAGIKKYFRQMRYIAVFAVIIALLNPLFTSRGDTVLFFAFGSPFSLEALIYGLSIAGMLVSVILWFSCYHEIVSSDKFMFVFGRMLPTAALMISMIFRFVPDMREKSEEINDAQAALTGAGGDNKKDRLKSAVRAISILMSWSMENSIETAASMRCRGYGTAKRGSFSIFKIRYYDAAAFIILIAAMAFAVYSMMTVNSKLEFYPYITGLYSSPAGYLCYAGFLLFPLFLEGCEAVRCAVLK